MKNKIVKGLIALVAAMCLALTVSTPAQAVDARWVYQACGHISPYQAKLYVEPSQYTKMTIHYYKGGSGVYIGTTTRYSKGSVIVPYYYVKFIAIISGAGTFSRIYGYC